MVKVLQCWVLIFIIMRCELHGCSHIEKKSYHSCVLDFIDFHPAKPTHRNQMQSKLVKYSNAQNVIRELQ
jgi:hypothetical protein